MKQFFLVCLFIMGFLGNLPVYGEELSLKKKDKEMDYQFVTGHTRQTDIEHTFFNCTFGASQAEVSDTLSASPDLKITESIYGKITLNAVFFHDMLYQTAQLLFSRNQFYSILLGSSFRNYKDALNVYLHTKKRLAEEYGPSLFHQKKEDMVNIYDLNGKNACMLTLAKKSDTDNSVRFHLILNYWNKKLQPNK